MKRATAVMTGLAGIVLLTLVGNALAVHPRLPDPSTVGSWGPVTATPTRRTVPGAANTAAPAPGRSLTAYVTAYTWYDNDPPGPAIADPVLHRTAGGTGTYADPVTLAVAAVRFAPGTRMYLPHVRRYFVVEDTCAACGGRPTWIDMWIDGRTGTPAAVRSCAERLTGDFTVEVDPPAGRPVESGPLFGSAGCYAR